MSWRLFGGAAIIVGGLLLKAGAPVIAVAAGIGLAGFFNWQRWRASRRRLRNGSASTR